MLKVLVIDDDKAVTNYFMVFLMQTGRFETTVLNDSRQTCEMLQKENFDVMLLDMDMPHISGLDVLRSMQENSVNIPVIVITGVSDLEMAVKAMKRGAFDYLTKPIDDEKLLEVIDKAIEHHTIHEDIGKLPEELKREDLTHARAFKKLPTQDQEMIRLFHQAEKLADIDLSIFIWGENGTGKEPLARAIHATSERSDGPFIAIDADSQDQSAFPAFFFGRDSESGDDKNGAAGILEQADKGTLFLNNIDSLATPVQVRLKRVIQEGEFNRESSAKIRKVDVRLIVSSTMDLASSEYKQKFSRDLLYHLMVNSLRIPPLRERVDDIPLLAGHFLAQAAEEAGKDIHGFSDGFVETLQKYPFPNNTRELSTIVYRSVANCDDTILKAECLPPKVQEAVSSGRVEFAEFKPRSLSKVVREYVMQTLDHFDGDRTATLKALAIEEEVLDKVLGE
jgi:two-component system, NtrC family, response regulator HydG